MSLTIGSNISSLIAQRSLAKSTSRLSKNFERLSSGQRINSAADDAAGLAIAESLKSDKRIFNQGVRNFNDGISALNIADAALENLSSITVRLRELAEQSANGTYNIVQRSSMDKEAQSLAKEYLRIAQSTEFNGMKLFNGSTNDIRLQGGYGIEGSILASTGGAIGTGQLDSAVYSAPGFSGEQLGSKLADLNNDGIPDLVTTGNNDAGGDTGAYVAVQIGNGNGTFSSAQSYQISALGSGGGIDLGDLNGDGITDLVTTADTHVVVRLGTGSGTFGAQLSYTMDSQNTYSVALGDITGDGILDIVTGGYSGGDGSLSVRIGSGDGTFGVQVSYEMGMMAGVTDLALGDINGDGLLDAITSSSYGESSVRLGRGDGTFSSKTSYAMGTTGNTIEVFDLNNDGNLDLVAGGDGGSGQAFIRLGSSNGTFGQLTSYTMSGTLNDLKLADLNGDGHVDMIGVSSSSPGNVSVRLGVGDGTFNSLATYSNQSDTDIFTLSIGDLNNNGVPDMVLGGSNLGNSTTSARLSTTVSGVAPLMPFSLVYQNQAKDALTQFENAQKRLSIQRAQIGASQSRIQIGINNLLSAAENYEKAKNQITNADIAFESSQLLRLNILQQASSAVLAQANQQPQLAILLLTNNT